MSLVRYTSLALAVTFSLGTFAAAATLFDDGAESLGNYTQVADSRTSAAVINYSSLSIPEAPGHVAGSGATTGIQLTANKGSGTGAITGLNLILGSTPITFSGTHTLQFYAWMNLPSDAAVSTTEGYSGGVARQGTSNAIYNNFRTSRGDGAWFFMTNENGASVDYRALNGSVGVVGLNASDPAIVNQYNAAFTGAIGGADAPANEWVKVQVLFDTSTATPTVSTYFNGILFSTISATGQTQPAGTPIIPATPPTSGYAWFGYEDTSAAVGTPDSLSGIFDNISVFEGNAVPEPTTLAALGLGGLAFVRRRKMT